MDSISLTNFRCFQDLEVSLKPLTLLIGENSTGKSSFLAAVRLAWDAAFSSKPLDFNEEPFLLGAYDQIAHYRGGRAGRAASFTIMSSMSVRSQRPQESSTDRASLQYTTVFTQAGSHPVIAQQFLRYGDHTLSVDFKSSEKTPKIELKTKGRTVSLPITELARGYRFSEGSPLDWGFIAFMTARRAEAEPNARPSLSDEDMKAISDMGRHTRATRSDRPIPVAPVRSKPLRTYNPISVAPLPEGDHIPMVLAKTYFEDKNKWTMLREVLESFGAESGLFADLTIRPLGDSESEPFQLRVKIEGPPSNLIDVGYGVSQVLPILVDAILADRGETFLLQQPEVHLHPRAQAALGSFLVRMSEQGKRFIVETHSDYLIDRIRMEVRDSKRTTPDDVAMLFFRRTGIQVAVDSILLDSAGNLLNVPTDYREFFFAEERRLLGV